MAFCNRRYQCCSAICQFSIDVILRFFVSPMLFDKSMFLDRCCSAIRHFSIDAVRQFATSLSVIFGERPFRNRRYRCCAAIRRFFIGIVLKFFVSSMLFRKSLLLHLRYSVICHFSIAAVRRFAASFVVVFAKCRFVIEGISSVRFSTGIVLRFFVSPMLFGKSPFLYRCCSAIRRFIFGGIRRNAISQSALSLLCGDSSVFHR